MIKVCVQLFVFLVLMSAKLIAADSCTILFNKHIIYQGQVEQENAIARVTPQNFKEADYFVIRYKSENESKGWIKTFYLVDSNNQNIKTIKQPKQNSSVSVNASVFYIMKRNRAPVFVYTTYLPADPMLASRVRVRRVLLCKIEWN